MSATGKDHARINLSIWGDDDWLDLEPDAQHLYFVLWTSPTLSYCGAGEWHPARIAQLAGGWTHTQVEHAAAKLSARQFILIDTTTSEFLLRSWMKHDGLWRTPNMAVSMANARAAMASRPLRGVVVHEARKLRDANPDSGGWTRAAVESMLGQKPVDPADLEPFNPEANPTSKGGSNPWGNPSPNPTANPGPNQNLRDGVNPGSNPAPTPAPTPLLLQKEGGNETGERHQGNTTDPNDPPPPTCPRHPGGTDDPCSACRRARQEREHWDTTRRDTETQAARAEAAAASRRAHEQAELRIAEIDRCDLCDDDGYLIDDDGLVTGVCNHNPGQATTNQRGMAQVRAAMTRPKKSA